MTHVGRYVCAERKRQSLTRGQLAKRIGYRSIAKGARRLCELEQHGETGSDDFLAKLTDVLGLDRDVVEQLVLKDHEQADAEHERWLNEPIEPHLVVRVLPALYVRKHLPEKVATLEEAERYARVVARKKRMRVTLVWSRRMPVWIDERGEVSHRSTGRLGELHAPHTKISGKKIGLKTARSLR